MRVSLLLFYVGGSFRNAVVPGGEGSTWLKSTSSTTGAATLASTRNASFLPDLRMSAETVAQVTVLQGRTL